MSKSNKPHKPDNIFARELSDLTQFSFNQQVVDVFPDMINRSVPGYQEIVHGIAKIAEQLCPESPKIYDLGCSLGSLSLAIAKQLSEKSPNIIAVDNSQAMIERCQQHISAFSFGNAISVLQADLLELSLEPCDSVVTNFTLQFVQPEQRQEVIDKIYRALNPGGFFVMSEKIQLEDEFLNHCIVELHHQFKRDNGYSELEIAQKRTALEKVMILDSLSVHQQRLKLAGFASQCVWFQHFNFLSILAIK